MSDYLARHATGHGVLRIAWYDTWYDKRSILIHLDGNRFKPVPIGSVFFTGDLAMQEIEANLVLKQEDIAYLWSGGALVVKVDGAEARVSLELSCPRPADQKRQQVRIKRVQAKRQPA
jgi:hypothetical protein